MRRRARRARPRGLGLVSFFLALALVLVLAASARGADPAPAPPVRVVLDSPKGKSNEFVDFDTFKGKVLETVKSQPGRAGTTP